MTFLIVTFVTILVTFVTISAHEEVIKINSPKHDFDTRQRIINNLIKKQL